MITTVTPDEARWVFNYSGVDEEAFEPAEALALLLINGVIILNSNYWEKDWPDEAKKTFALGVVCSDSFYFASADAEPMLYKDLEDVYDHWIQNEGWGPVVWCCKKRKQMPLKWAYDAIQSLGIWDLDKLELQSNTGK